MGKCTQNKTLSTLSLSCFLVFNFNQLYKFKKFKISIRSNQISFCIDFRIDCCREYIFTQEAVLYRAMISSYVMIGNNKKDNIKRVSFHDLFILTIQIVQFANGILTTLREHRKIILRKRVNIRVFVRM